MKRYLAQQSDCNHTKTMTGDQTNSCGENAKSRAKTNNRPCSPHDALRAVPLTRRSASAFLIVLLMRTTPAAAHYSVSLPLAMMKSAGLHAAQIPSVSFRTVSVAFVKRCLEGTSAFSIMCKRLVFVTASSSQRCKQLAILRFVDPTRPILQQQPFSHAAIQAIPLKPHAHTSRSKRYPDLPTII